MTTFAIVGGGLAGATAAQTLRDEGFDGELVLLGDELHRPYERPPLSKEYLQGKSPRDKVFVHPEGWYAEHDVDLRLGVSATALDVQARRLLTSDGSSVQYDRLLIATGSTPRRIAMPGADLDGVLYLRRLDDSDRIRAAFAARPSVVIVGAGWIGLETAAAARVAGLSVTVLEQAAAPLARILGSRMSAMFSQLHRDNGVDLRFGAQVQEITASGVVLGDGSTLPADAVVVAPRSRPTWSWSESASARRPAWPRPRGWPSATASPSTSTCAPRTRTSMPPATWRTPSTRCSGIGSGSSTGRTPGGRGRLPLAPCWARTLSTPGCRTSSATSTTSAWSTPAMWIRRGSRTWSCAATWRAAGSWRSGWSTGGCGPG
jgi:hypothetical protein